jgi:hypothetical protein
MPAKSLRDLSLLSYLMQGLPPMSTLLSARPRAFEWTKMAFHVCCEGGFDDSPVDNICGSVVGLCHADISQVVMFIWLPIMLPTLTFPSNQNSTKK